MAYYRGALQPLRAFGAAVGAPHEADLQATVAIVRTLEPVLAGNRYGFGWTYFAEEFDTTDSVRVAGWEALLEQIRPLQPHLCASTQEFVASFRPGTLSILLDGLDGSIGFAAGLPLFCSAVACLVDGRPICSAIYDPHHNEVYFGSARPSAQGRRRGAAWKWQVQSGVVTALEESRYEGGGLLATHLTRHHPQQRARLVAALLPLAEGFPRGIYMLNSGQLALAYVASGNLAAFVNPVTNIWDVVAGDLLITALGGSVCDFSGRALDYGSGAREVQVVAAVNREARATALQALRGGSGATLRPGQS